MYIVRCIHWTGLANMHRDDVVAFDFDVNNSGRQIRAARQRLKVGYANYHTAGTITTSQQQKLTGH